MANVAVAGWVGSTNLGDELVFLALRRKLHALGVGVEVASVDPVRTRADHGVRAVPTAGWPGALRRADGVLLGGGGLLQDATSAFNLPYHLARVWAARAGRRPFAGVGLGAGPLRTASGRAMVRRSLGAAVAVSVRDAASADVLREAGLPAPVVAADLAFSLPDPVSAASDRLVVCLRPWTGRRSALPVGAGRAPAPVPPWFLDRAAAALDAAARRTGLDVHLVAFQADRDDPVHRQVAARMRAPATLATPPLAGVLEEVATGRVVVAMRFHAGVAAVLGGRPAVLIRYSPKVGSLAADVGPGGAGLPFGPEAIDRLPGVVESVLGLDDRVADARDRLRRRERGNDEVLGRLLERLAAPAPARDP